jgi:hypothetical protein
VRRRAGQSRADQDRHREEVTKRDRDMPNAGPRRGAGAVERGGLEMRSAPSLKIPLHPEM